MELWKPVTGIVISLECPTNEMKVIGLIFHTVPSAVGYCHGYHSHLGYLAEVFSCSKRSLAHLRDKRFRGMM